MCRATFQLIKPNFFVLLEPGPMLGWVALLLIIHSVHSAAALLGTSA
jgi:hypothetical protein